MRRNSWGGHGILAATLVLLLAGCDTTSQRAAPPPATQSTTTTAQFPERAVYDTTPEPELRLITCGAFDKAAHSYQDNVIVYAKLATS